MTNAMDKTFLSDMDDDNDNYSNSKERRHGTISGIYISLRIYYGKMVKSYKWMTAVIALGVLTLILGCRSSSGFSFGRKSNLSDVDPLSYDFFKESVENRDFYDGINSYIMPEHRPLGFRNLEYTQVRQSPGFPPSPPKEKTSPHDGVPQNSDASLTASVASYLSNHRIQPQNSRQRKKQKKIYLVLGNMEKTGIERERSRQDWLIEKLSVLNKKLYAEKHHYELIYLNTDDASVQAKQKRYQHETREGWEKFDLLRAVMNSNSLGDPNVDEWFWYLDMHTLIMQPEKSLDQLLFSLIEKNSVSDTLSFYSDNLVSEKNYPMSWSSLSYKREYSSLDIDPETTGNFADNIDLIVSEDCYGINLNSFFIKRSIWSELLLDLLWDPVIFRQKHVAWTKLKKKQLPNKYGFSLKNDMGSNDNNKELKQSEIEERNCLEYFLTTQSWLRIRTLVVPTKLFSALSDDSCVLKSADALDLLDMDLDDELIDVLLETDKLDLSSLREKYSKIDSNSNINKLTAQLADVHYDPNAHDFLFNYAACRNDDCWKRTREAMAMFKLIHNRQLFDI